jgi:hypothetical protein
VLAVLETPGERMITVVVLGPVVAEEEFVTAAPALTVRAVSPEEGFEQAAIATSTRLALRMVRPLAHRLMSGSDYCRPSPGLTRLMLGGRVG